MAKFLFLPDGEDPDTYVRQFGPKAFTIEFEKALGFTEFFFQHLESTLDISTTEGKAALSKVAVPLIRGLPVGVFKQLVIKELSNRTGLDSDQLIRTTGLDSQPERAVPTARDFSLATTQRQLKLSTLAEYALQLLLRRPAMTLLVTDATIARLDGRPEWQILVELIRWAQEAKETFTVLLLSHYQDSSYFDYLRRLSEQDLVLSVDQFDDEFQATLKKMLLEGEVEQKQRVVDDLIGKPLSELTPDERVMLQNHLKK